MMVIHRCQAFSCFVYLYFTHSSPILSSCPTGNPSDGFYVSQGMTDLNPRESDFQAGNYGDLYLVMVAIRSLQQNTIFNFLNKLLLEQF